MNARIVNHGRVVVSANDQSNAMAMGISASASKERRLSPGASWIDEGAMRMRCRLCNLTLLVTGQRKEAEPTVVCPVDRRVRP